MRGQIAVTGGLKIRRLATIKDNAEIKRDLNMVRFAIKDGLLDSVITLHTAERNEDGHVIQRNITIPELDEQIKNTRQSKMDSMEFAYEQMDLFSKYLRKNIHSGNGLSAEMIMNFVETKDLYKIVDLVLKEVEESKTNFEEGKYNNIDGTPETLLDHITAKLDNKYHRQRLGMEEN